jgi:hypothetical protein
MDSTTSLSAAAGIAIAVGLLALAALPLLVSFATRRGTFRFLAILYLFLSWAAGIASMATSVAAGAMGGGIVAVLVLPLAALLWLTALMFGIAAGIDGMAERRSNDGAFTPPRPRNPGPPRMESAPMAPRRPPTLR